VTQFSEILQKKTCSKNTIRNFKVRTKNPQKFLLFRKNLDNKNISIKNFNISQTSEKCESTYSRTLLKSQKHVLEKLSNELSPKHILTQIFCLLFKKNLENNFEKCGVI